MRERDMMCPAGGRTGTLSTIRIGARGSNLSRRQVEEVRRLLSDSHPGVTVDIEFFVTTGDKQLDTPLPLIGGKGVFTSEIEAALLDGRIDLAVHSLKDLPVENPTGIVIGGVPQRASVADVLISRSGRGLHELPPNPVVGTSSHRRAAQLVRARPDARPRSIRGNVETRIRKAMDPAGDYDAILLARAGLERLGLLNVVTEELPLDLMLPAPGQAALAVQCRDNAPSIALAASINHAETSLAALAERAFLAGLGGGCSAPVAAHARFQGESLILAGRVLAIDGTESVDVTSTFACTNPEMAWNGGVQLAKEALSRGAEQLMERVG
jgi:hydroxymethylbilane synthase